MAQDKKQIVYVTMMEGVILGVYSSREKAFKRIVHFEDTAWRNHARITQTINMPDGEEEEDVNETSYRIGVPIHVHVDAYPEDVFGILINHEETDTSYMILDFKVK